MKCHKCGSLNPEGAIFCLKCGAKLEEAAEERKFATILFSDLKGFTSLSEQKDPEEIREIIKDLFSRFDTLLNNFRVGHHEYIGDAVLALFGVSVSYADDAERAINAALSMQEEVKRFSKKIGLTLRMRIGVNSGEVVYGEVPGKITVTGDAVNIAQRLQSVSKPGKILVSDTTAKLVSGRFRMAPCAPLKLKGKKEKVIAFEVISPKRIYPAFLSPMIGRDEEFEKLKEIFNKVTSHQLAPTFTVITGDMGVGKSRFLFEFQKYLDKISPEFPRPIKVISVRCLQYGTFIYQSLIYLLRDLFDIKEFDNVKTVMSKIEKGALPEDPLSKHFLGFFFGIKWPHSPLEHLKPDSARQTAFVTLKNLIEHISTHQQIVLIFEDIHYADSGTADFLEYFTQAEISFPPMILLAGELEGFVEEIKDGRRKGRWDFIELLPLKEEESRALIQNLWKEKGISEFVMKTIIEKGGGNPLFFEELIKDLKESEILLEEEESFILRESGVLLPDSLWALLEARVDRLPSEERQILRTASVIGRVFWGGLLEILTGNRVERELELLEQKGYIYERQPSQMMHDREYIFSHELLREAAYKTLLKKQRKELHSVILKYLEKNFRKEEIQASLYLQLAAYHSELGEEYGKGADFYEKLGDLAKEKYASQEAITSHTNAINILTEKLGLRDNDKKVGELIKKRAESEVLLSFYEKAMKDYEKLLLSKDERIKISGFIGIGDVYNRRGDFDKSIEYSFQAKNIAEKRGLDILKAKALNSIGLVSFRKGDLDKGLKIHKQAHRTYEKLISESKRVLKKRGVERT